jgi:hypothetical protein
MARLTDIVGGALRGFTHLAAVAATYFNQLAEVARTFRVLRPLCGRGWTISTYSMMLAPEAHRRAADSVHNLNESCKLLEDAWSNADLRASVCSIVPYLYPPDDRAVGQRRTELLLRASQRFSEGLYEEAVLLVYSQVDGLFQDRAATAEAGYGRLFSKRPVKQSEDDPAREFTEIVRATKTMIGVDEAFFLAVRDAMTASVRETTLEDRASRHGVLHGRVLGYGTRTRAAQAFAFLAGAIELLVASWERLPLTRHEGYEMPFSEAPPGLRIAVSAVWFSQVRSVYLALDSTPDSTLLFAVNQPPASN